MDTTYAYNLRKTGQYTITDICAQFCLLVFWNYAATLTIHQNRCHALASNQWFRNHQRRLFSGCRFAKDSINTIALLVMMFLIDWSWRRRWSCLRSCIWLYMFEIDFVLRIRWPVRHWLKVLACKKCCLHGNQQMYRAEEQSRTTLPRLYRRVFESAEKDHQ